jgi:phospholipase/lecithinase/hemolysin
LTSRYTTVSFFGDSLTDVGNLYSAILTEREKSYYESWSWLLGDGLARQFAQDQAQQDADQQASGRLGEQLAYSNEYTYATYAGELAGFDVDNRGLGGARAVGEQTPLGTDFDTNLTGQVDRYLDDVRGDAGPSAAAVLFIGSNDFGKRVLDPYVDGGGGNPAALQNAGEAEAQRILDQIETSARDLHEAQVETVYLTTLPLVGFYPAYDDLSNADRAAADAAMTDYNAAVIQLAADLTDQGLDTQVVDFSAVSTALTEDPTGFGIIDERDNFIKPGRHEYDTDQTAFYDPIHPGEAVQQAWGGFTVHVLAGGDSALLSDSADRFSGDANGNAVFGLGGNDTIDSWRGDDILFGGTGSDALMGDRGADVISGGRGHDVILGQIDNDILNGGRGNDELRGADGDDVIIDDLGADLSRGGDGDDVFVFYDAAFLGGNTSRDTVVGGDGDDTLYLVLDSQDYSDFQAGRQDTVLSRLKIEVSEVESIVAIDGRENVEADLSHYAWFAVADAWGLIAAPAPVDMA